MKSTDTPRTDACPHCKDTLCEPASLVRDNLCWMRERAEKAEAEVERLQNGFQGSCYCCEPVGIINQQLEAEVEELRQQKRNCLEIIDDDSIEKSELKAEFERLKTLMHQTIWFVDDMIKTHTNGCEHCFKKHGAMIALFKDITEEPQWPINPTEK